MSDQPTTADTTASHSAKRPAYIAYSVRDRGEGKKAKFTEIGVAFPHKDGKGFDILYDAVPLSGRITLRVPEKKEQKYPGSPGRAALPAPTERNRLMYALASTNP